MTAISPIAAAPDAAFSPAELAGGAEGLVAAARAGRMFVLTGPDGHGDLAVPAQAATATVINFMARHARGLVCLALPASRIGELGLRPAGRPDLTCHGIAFTASIEARSGVSTGISATDLARTIAVAIGAECGRGDIVTPGHVFPIAVPDAGSLRAESAALAVTLLAGCTPAAVICRILREDGDVAKGADLDLFADRHGLELGTTAEVARLARRLTPRVFPHRTTEG